MVLPAEKTLLIITPVGIPLYSARGLTQTLTPVPEAKPTPKRTVNGEARFLGGTQMRKYNSVITCTDVNAPPFGGLWPGDVVVVDCVAELVFKTAAGSPERLPVTDSLRTVGAFSYYRPRITFLVVDFEESVQEYEAMYPWRLTLTER